MRNTSALWFFFLGVPVKQKHILNTNAFVWTVKRLKMQHCVQWLNCPPLQYCCVEYCMQCGRSKSEFYFCNISRNNCTVCLPAATLHPMVGHNKKSPWLFCFPDANDPPTDIRLTNQNMNEESDEGVLIASIVLVDQDGDQPTCVLIDSAGDRVKVVGTNLLTGPTKTNFETMGQLKMFQVKLNCSDQHRLYIVKSFDIKVLGEQICLWCVVLFTLSGHAPITC